MVRIVLDLFLLGKVLKQTEGRDGCEVPANCGSIDLAFNFVGKA